MKRNRIGGLVCRTIVLLLVALFQGCTRGDHNNLTLNCSENNDLFIVLKENRIGCIRYDNPAEAVDNAKEGSGVMILADFLIRIQVNSEKHSELDGGWFRAFDFRQWEYLGSNADSGWGAWTTVTDTPFGDGELKRLYLQIS